MHVYQGKTQLSIQHKLSFYMLLHCGKNIILNLFTSQIQFYTIVCIASRTVQTHTSTWAVSVIAREVDNLLFVNMHTSN